MSLESLTCLMFGKIMQNGPVLERESMIFRKRFELITQNFSGNWPMVLRVRLDFELDVRNVVSDKFIL